MKLTDIEVFQTQQHQPRSEWEFQVEVKTALEAVSKRIAYHDGRSAFWDAELAGAASQMKANTKIVEQQITGGVQHVAQVDQVASQRVAQCQAKLAHHRAKLWEYQAWRWVFGQVPDGIKQWFSLSDIQFFGIVPNPVEESEDGS